LLSLLTPCVFPMIPLTVTFFTTSSVNRGQAVRKALFYGFSIVTIFTLIGLFTGPVLANVLSTHWIPNTLFFLICSF
jgi:cytochrome c biogenesis protein CcdA